MRTRLAANLEGVRARIAKAAMAAGRSPEEIELLAVTKSAPAELAEGLFRLGATDLGENRLAGFDEKLAHFAALGLTASAGPAWHYIGHIQRNKARRVVERSAVIHSIDSVRLYDNVARHADELGLRPGLYLQLKLAPEDAKGGLEADELEQLAQRAAEASRRGGPRLLGLMGMAPLCPGATEAERRAAAAVAFEQAARVAAASRATYDTPDGRARLSLGMTGDLEEAIAAGSTCVRVGSALFDGLLPPRPTPEPPRA
ncbi:MAG: YggS family pyridoxal phosphate-dependent enzyme [Planctomycetota bacterium]|nr:YggS family pyridoxal phosphate-dependent enzyme [Planctomycetota bacterium]